MEQAFASDMWGTLHFRMAYRDMAKKFYAYGLCDPCHQPTNYIYWSLANRECEQAYKLQPICGEYGESIFSLSQYTSENVA